MTMAAAKARMITMREFKNNFAKIQETVKVVRARGEIEIIGTWTPAKTKDDKPVSAT